MAEQKKASPLMSMRKYFNVPGSPLTLKEIKQFKSEDPEGCEELGKLCAEHYDNGGE